MCRGVAGLLCICFTGLVTAADVLLVDDDDNSPDVRSSYTAALDALAIGYDIRDVSTNGQPTATEMQAYAAVIWFTGDDRGLGTSGPDATGAAHLGTYLDVTGGCLFMSSQDYLLDHNSDLSFATNYFGLNVVGSFHDVQQTTVTGSGAFSGLGPYTLTYPFSNASDQINPTAPSAVAFTGNIGNAALYKDSGAYRTTLWTFPFEAIPTANDRTAAMRKALEYCQVPELMRKTYRFERLWPTLQQPWYFGAPSDVAVDLSGFVYALDEVNGRIMKFNAQGQFVTQWGERGLDPGQLGGPVSLVATDDGFIYVADRLNHRIQKFTLNGAFVSTWGSSGSGTGQFSEPAGVAADPNGTIYVVDAGNHRIQTFNANGEFVRQWGSEGSSPGQFNFTRPSSASGIKAGGVTVDSAGFIYVADAGNHRVQKFSGDGTFVSQWGSQGTASGQFNEPQDIVAHGGFLHVLDQQNTRVQRFSPTGTFVNQFGSFGTGDGELGTPQGIAVDAQGFVYVADFLSRIIKFKPTGEFVSQWGSTGETAGRFNQPRRLAVDASGNIFVADFFNSRVQKFDSTGQPLLQWGSEGTADGEFTTTGGVAVDPGGFVYVTDIGGNRVQKFNAAGNFVSKWGTQGSGNSQFNFPTSVAIDASNEIYVIDAGNKRIQKFDQNGTFLLAFGSSGTGNGQFETPAGIAVDAAGFVYVVDQRPSDLAQQLLRVQKFTSGGVFVAKWGAPGLAEGQVGVAAGLFIDDAGLLYIAETATGRISVFTGTGRFVQTIGENGFGFGQFALASDTVVLADGRVVALDALNNNIQIFKPVQFEANTKAVIVAGGGNFPGNNLWDATKAMANTAYRALLYQGFTRDKIFYLSQETDRDIDGNKLKDDIDGDATTTGLQHAITTWAADAQDVVVYLTDHGGANNFRISPTETISPTQLDGWLDQLQTAISGRVIVIYDACHAGSFTPGTSAQNRVVITSSAADELAYFTGQGALSFSTYFWNQIFNGNSVLSAFQSARDALTMSPVANSPLQTPQLNNDADGNGTPNQASDQTALNSIVIGSGTSNPGGLPQISTITPAQNISGTSTATVIVTGVTDSDGIGRVRAILKPPGFDPGASDNPITELPSFDLLRTSPTSDSFQGTFTSFTTPGVYEVRVYAEDRLGNTSQPKLTSITVGNPLTRRAVLVAGGASTDPLWPSIERAASSAYQALKFQGYKNSEIAFFSATTVNGVEQLSTLSNLDLALAPAQHSNSQDVVVYVVGDITGNGLRVNATQSLTSDVLDNRLDTLQAALPGKLTVLVDGPNSGDYISRLDAPGGGELKRIRISSTTGQGPSLFPLAGTVSFSRFFWQQVTNGASVRNAFINARDNISVLSAGTQRARLDADGDGDKLDLSLIRTFSLGPGVLSAGDAPLVDSVSDAQTLSDGATTATLFADNVTTTGTVQRVFAVVTPPVARAVAPQPATVDLNFASGVRYQASYGGFGPTAGVYQVSTFTTDVEGVVSLPVKSTVTQRVGPDAYESDNQSADASVIVPNNVLAQFHTIHQASDEDWVKFFAVSGIDYNISVTNVGPTADPVIELYQPDAATIFGAPRDDGEPGVMELLSFKAPSSGVFFVRILNDPPAPGGIGGHYDLNVDIPVAPDLGTIDGLVSSDVQVANLAGAVVTAGSNAGAITLGDGTFEVRLSEGTVDVTIAANGYETATANNVEVTSNAQTEVNVQLTPKDDDNDGLPDPWELEHFGNLNQTPSGDFDNDGMPNNFEFQHGFDPKTNDAGQDADGDGFSNLREFQLGTNPKDANSVPNPSLDWLPILLLE